MEKRKILKIVEIVLLVIFLINTISLYNTNDNQKNEIKKLQTKLDYSSEQLNKHLDAITHDRTCHLKDVLDLQYKLPTPTKWAMGMTYYCASEDVVYFVQVERDKY